MLALGAVVRSFWLNQAVLLRETIGDGAASQPNAGMIASLAAHHA